jgi:NADH-quinone oxidoreductase subunit E
MCAEKDKPCCRAEAAIDFGPADEILKAYRGKPGVLIPVLQKVQAQYGWLPQPLVEHIARELNIYLSEVYGVISFYAQFYTKPRGRYTIHVCRGTACHVKGSLRIMEQLEEELEVKAGEMTRDGKFTIEEVNCIGACGIAPVMVVGGKTFGSLTVAQALEAVRNFDEE